MPALQVSSPHRTADLRTVSFPQGAQSFIKEMKSRVHAYFAEGAISQKANPQMVLKTVVMISLVAVPYILIMTNRLSPWLMLGLCVVMGVGVAGCGFSIAHDALHGGYSSNRKVNAVFLRNLLDDPTDGRVVDAAHLGEKMVFDLEIQTTDVPAE